MSRLTDVSAIIISIIATGVLLATLILTGLSGIRDDMNQIRGEVSEVRGEINQIRGDVAQLQQRTARIEGQLTLLIDAWDINKPAVPVTTDN